MNYTIKLTTKQIELLRLAMSDAMHQSECLNEDIHSTYEEVCKALFYMSEYADVEKITLSKEN